MNEWLLALVLAQSLDISTTCAVLHRGGRELNPLLPSTCVGIASVKGSLTVGAAWHLRKPKKLSRLEKVALAAAIGSGAYGAYHNIRELRK